MPESCANCKFYLYYFEWTNPVTKKKSSNGNCLRHSPIAKGLNLQDRYPETFSESWCGDWKK